VVPSYDKSDHSSATFLHCLAHPCLGIAGPVATFELEEHRSIGLDVGRLYQENFERLSCLIKLGDDFFVKLASDRFAFEKPVERLSVRSDSFGVCFWNELQLLVDHDCRADVFGLGQSRHYDLHGFELGHVDGNRLDSWRSLKWVGGVSYDDPVAVSESRKFCLEHRLK